MTRKVEQITADGVLWQRSLNTEQGISKTLEAISRAWGVSVLEAIPSAFRKPSERHLGQTFITHMRTFSKLEPDVSIARRVIGEVYEERLARTKPGEKETSLGLVDVKAAIARYRDHGNLSLGPDQPAEDKSISPTAIMTNSPRNMDRAHDVFDHNNITDTKSQPRMMIKLHMSKQAPSFKKSSLIKKSTKKASHSPVRFPGLAMKHLKTNDVETDSSDEVRKPGTVRKTAGLYAKEKKQVSTDEQPPKQKALVKRPRVESNGGKSIEPKTNPSMEDTDSEISVPLSSSKRMRIGSKAKAASLNPNPNVSDAKKKSSNVGVPQPEKPVNDKISSTSKGHKPSKQQPTSSRASKEAPQTSKPCSISTKEQIFSEPVTALEDDVETPDMHGNVQDRVQTVDTISSLDDYFVAVTPGRGTEEAITIQAPASNRSIRSPSMGTSLPPQQVETAQMQPGRSRCPSPAEPEPEEYLTTSPQTTEPEVFEENGRVFTRMPLLEFVEELTDSDDTMRPSSPQQLTPSGMTAPALKRLAHTLDEENFDEMLFQNRQFELRNAPEQRRAQLRSDIDKLNSNFLAGIKRVHETFLLDLSRVRADPSNEEEPADDGTDNGHTPKRQKRLSRDRSASSNASHHSLNASRRSLNASRHGSNASRHGSNTSRHGSTGSHHGSAAPARSSSESYHSDMDHEGSADSRHSSPEYMRISPRPLTSYPEYMHRDISMWLRVK